MKTLRKEIKETSLDKVEAYKAINTNESVSAKEVVGKQFEYINHVIYQSTIIDENEQTGEVTKEKMENVIILTSIGYVGSNSKTIIASLKDMLADLGEETVKALPLKITSGKAKSGNTYYDIEIA